MVWPRTSPTWILTKIQIYLTKLNKSIEEPIQISSRAFYTIQRRSSSSNRQVSTENLILSGSIWTITMVQWRHRVPKSIIRRNNSVKVFQSLMTTNGLNLHGRRKLWISSTETLYRLCIQFPCGQVLNKDGESLSMMPTESSTLPMVQIL